MTNWTALCDTLNYPNKREMLKALYTKHNSTAKVGDQLKLSNQAVLNHMHSEGLKVNGPGGKNHVGHQKEGTKRVRIMQMLQNGYDTIDICSRLNTSEHYVLEVRRQARQCAA